MECNEIEALVALFKEMVRSRFEMDAAAANVRSAVKVIVVVPLVQILPNFINCTQWNAYCTWCIARLQPRDTQSVLLRQH